MKDHNKKDVTNKFYCFCGMHNKDYIKMIQKIDKLFLRIII